MTAVRDYYGPFRPPCPAWATRADIEAALAIGYPLDESYIRRALDLTHLETQGPDSEAQRLTARAKAAEDEVSALRDSVDNANEAQSIAEDEAKRVHGVVKTLLPLLPASERWPAMRAFCAKLEIGPVSVLRLADLAGAELEHARRFGRRQIGTILRLRVPFHGHAEVRVVGFDCYHHTLLAPGDADVAALDPLDPLDWFVDEWKWAKEHKPEIAALPAALLRPSHVCIVRPGAPS